MVTQKYNGKRKTKYVDEPSQLIKVRLCNAGLSRALHRGATSFRETCRGLRALSAPVLTRLTSSGLLWKPQAMRFFMNFCWTLLLHVRWKILRPAQTHMDVRWHSLYPMPNHSLAWRRMPFACARPTLTREIAIHPRKTLPSSRRSVGQPLAPPLLAATALVDRIHAALLAYFQRNFSLNLRGDQLWRRCYCMQLTQPRRPPCCQHRCWSVQLEWSPLSCQRSIPGVLKVQLAHLRCFHKMQSQPAVAHATCLGQADDPIRVLSNHGLKTSLDASDFDFMMPSEASRIISKISSVRMLRGLSGGEVQARISAQICERCLPWTMQPPRACLLLLLLGFVQLLACRSHPIVILFSLPRLSCCRVMFALHTISIVSKQISVLSLKMFTKDNWNKLLTCMRTYCKWKAFKLQYLSIFGLVARCLASHPAVKAVTDWMREWYWCCGLIYRGPPGYHLEYYTANTSPSTCIDWGHSITCS